MNPQSTYTLTQKNEYGHPVNTITGLAQDYATQIADVLATGDAYQGGRPWTCEIEREPSREEQLAAAVRTWVDQSRNLQSTGEAVACLRHVADRLESLGDVPLGSTALDISLHVMGNESEDMRMVWVDQMAALFGMDAEMPDNGHYSAGHKRGGVRFVTIVHLAPEGGPVVHRHAGGSVGGPGENSAECACGTGFYGFDSHAEASALLDKHIEAETAKTVQQIAPERLAEILAELNRLTSDGENWWDWAESLAVFDDAATAAAVDTGTLHLIDGTVLRWSETARWTASPAKPVDQRPLVSDATIDEAEQLARMVAPMDMSLPQDVCGCPVKGGVVEHCPACIERTEAVSA